MRSRILAVAGIGPSSIFTGSQPTVVWSTIRARGVRPSSSAFSARHQQHRGGAVGDLRGVAGGDLAVLLERRLQLRERLEVGVGADALVGDDLVSPLTCIGMISRSKRPSSVAWWASRCERTASSSSSRARDLPLVGDHLGAEALADDVVLLHQLGREREAELLLGLHAGRERQVAHVLDAAADDDVVDAGGDQRGGEVDGLLGRAALAVDRRRRRLDREALLQPGVARDVEGLLAELLHAAGDDVLDLAGVDARRAR